ncbi:porin [Pseudoduganella dura]|uniref:porin n=1 Tax=Pseudoduganella dura TaxID=321982 RepID=UPI001E293F46|nr:porin [Pseudoduganella dura]
MKSICTGVLLATASLAASLATSDAHAGATIPFGEDKSVSVGFGMRGSYSSIENGAPDGSHANDFNLDSARIFLGASLNKNIKGMFNTEWDGDRIRVLDAAAQFAISPELNVWAGRLLSPSDRANMAGPYYSLGGGYWAGVASRYGYNGGIFRGRDDGIVVWGNVAGDKLGYSFGVFEGHTFGIGSLTDDGAKAVGLKAADKPMYAGRVQYDFWDAEPGYYGTGTYLGSKDILAIGLAGRQQKDGVLTVAGIGDYESWNVDFLMEKRLGSGGAVSVEAAYYDYDTGNVVLSEQGKAWSAGAGYIFPIGRGSLQPYVRYQKFEADTAIDTRQQDVGLNWILDGYNAQVGAAYSRTKMTGTSDQSRFVVALQLQY